MPLKAGPGAKSANIKELMNGYHKTGMIGNTRPKNPKHAAKIAAAIAYSKAKGK